MNHFTRTYALLGLIGIAVALATPARAQGTSLSLARSDGAQIPIKIYGTQAGCIKTMIVSHGLGGSAEGLAGFAGHMAGQGWRVIVMGHAESGPGLLRQGLFSGQIRNTLKGFAGDPARHRARMLDLDATLALAMRSCRPSQLVLAGHSMGATTTMLEAGTQARFGRMGANRFDAYVALSPQGIGYMWAKGAWAGVTKPVLMITGTRDSGADGDWTTRLSAFEGLPPGKKRLVVIDGATHFNLGGNDARNGAVIGMIASEYLASIAAGGKLILSRTQGMDIRDK